jgi:hypothetical protein
MKTVEYYLVLALHLRELDISLFHLGLISKVEDIAYQFHHCVSVLILSLLFPMSWGTAGYMADYVVPRHRNSVCNLCLGEGQLPKSSPNLRLIALRVVARA